MLAPTTPPTANTVRTGATGSGQHTVGPAAAVATWLARHCRWELMAQPRPTPPRRPPDRRAP